MQNLEEIYIDNYELVYKYLLANSHDENISEELAQETFYRAVKNINKFNENSKISTWLCKIAKNLWVDEVKKNSKLKTLDENSSEIAFEDQIFADEDKIRLFKKIQNFNVEMRDVMYLRLSGELNFKEIGEIMGKTETWVRVTFYRGKQRLKEDNKNERKSRV